MANVTRAWIDLEGYLSRAASVTNHDGRRSFGAGIRTFNCPFCGDQRSRGWLTLNAWQAGCWNAGCEADPRLEGGALEWVRRREGFPTRGAAWAWLATHWVRATPHPGAILTPIDPDDLFCRFPPRVGLDTVAGQPALAFAQRQWLVSPATLKAFGVTACITGRYARRLIIPVTIRRVPVTFQARTYQDAKVKYLSARHGPPDDPKAECRRPIGSVLFHLDAVRPGNPILLVEGPGDVMRWTQTRRPEDPVAVGLMGTAITPARLRALKAAQPGTITVALDADVPTAKTLRTVAELQAWGLAAKAGRWVGGKAAGDGAALTTWPLSVSPASLVKALVQ